MRYFTKLGITGLSLAALVAVGCHSNPVTRPEIKVDVQNKTSVKVTITISPLFSLPGRPAYENVRTLVLDSGQAKSLDLLAGDYKIESRPDDPLAYPDYDPESGYGDAGEGYQDVEYKLYASGEIVLDQIKMRWFQSKDAPAPTDLPVRTDDPTDVSGALD